MPESFNIKLHGFKQDYEEVDEHGRESTAISRYVDTNMELTGCEEYYIYDLQQRDDKIYLIEPYTKQTYEKPHGKREAPGTRFIMYEGDTFEVVNDFLRNNPNAKQEDCLVLNFANSYQVGGGYRRGASAQEEDLFRRSNYNYSLHNAKEFIQREGLYHEQDFEKAVYANSRKFIPFKRCIVSPNVTVYGKYEYQGKNKTHLHLDPENPIMKLPMIAAAAPCFAHDKKPYIDYVVKMGQFDERQKGCVTQETRWAIVDMWTTIFLTAIARRTKHFFIGPIGCGAFAWFDGKIERQDRYRALMARIIREMLEQYSNYFDTIIYSDLNKKSSNYTIFFEEFTKIFAIEQRIAEKDMKVIERDSHAPQTRLDDNNRPQTRPNSVQRPQDTSTNNQNPLPRRRKKLQDTSTNDYNTSTNEQGAKPIHTDNSYLWTILPIYGLLFISSLVGKLAS